MKLTVVPPSDYQTLDVPLHIRRAVQILNEALAIDRGLITFLLMTAVPVEGETQERLLHHPTIVLRTEEGLPDSLSAFGLINGFFTQGRFRLYAYCETETEEQLIEYFGVKMEGV